MARRVGVWTALSAASRVLAALVLGLVLAMSGPGSAQAQMPEGVLGWEWNGSFFASPRAACMDQWRDAGMDNGFSRFLPIGAVEGRWDMKECNWTSYQYLCYEETGGGINDCGTQLPSGVVFRCDGDYEAVAPGRCVRPDDRVPEQQACRARNGAAFNPIVGNPIVLSTGAKLLSATDFETDDDLFAIRRSYRSNPVGRSVNFESYPLGLAAGWVFDFAWELQLGYFLGTPSGPLATVSVITPEGVGYDFRLTDTGDWEPDPTTGAAYAPTGMTLEFVGTLPSNLQDIQAAQSEWILTDEQDRVWRFVTFAQPNRSFFATGRPVERTTKEGYVWTFDYGSDAALDSITDSFGRTAGFTWSEFFITALPNVPGSAPFAEAVSEIALPDGSTLSYAYDPPPATSAPSTTSIERLVGVEKRDATNAVFDSTIYHYEDTRFPHQVTGVTDNRNVRMATYEYDALGRAITTAGAGGADVYEVEYAETSAELTRTVTNPLGKETVYRFERFGSWPIPNDIRLTQIEGEPSPNCPGSMAQIAYGSDTFIEAETDEEGRVTSYERDARGRPTTIVQADGAAEEREITIAWHATLNVPVEIAAPGLTTTMDYSLEGRLLSLTQEDTTSHTAPYATNGRTREWAYGYTTEGLLSTVDGPLPGTGDTVSYAYTASGYLEETTDEVGHTTTVTSHDGRGAPLIVEDENGVETVFTYDLNGRPLSVVVDPGADESEYAFAYDPTCNLERIDLPEGGWLEYVYDDSSRVIGIENDRGETQAFTRNDMGQPVGQTVRNPSATLTMQMSWAYDELGRAIRAIGAGSQTWEMAYDKVDNLTTVTDARNEAWAVGWDALDRVISETDPEAAEVEYARAPNDAVTAFEDGRDLETARVVDGFGLTVFEDSPDRGERTYWYDEADRLIRVVDGDGVETEYAYDDAGRRLSETFSGSPADTVTYAYDATAGGNVGVGRLTSVTDPSGGSAFTYDAQGRLTQDAKTIGGETYAVAYVYDAAGDVAAMTYPSGRVVQIARDPDGQITAVSMRDTVSAPVEALAGGVTHAPFGPLTGLTYGNGLALSQTHDQNYWQTGLEVSASGADRLELTYSRNDNGALDGVADGLSSGRAASFGYTDAGRLQYAVGAWGDESYAYDAAGNRTEVRTDNGGTTDYAFAIPDPSSNRIEEVRDTGWNVIRDLTWRDGGDLYQQDFTGGDAQTLLYDARKRLVELEVNAATAASYGYDYAGQRVSATVGAATVHYIFDPDGRLLAEHDGSTGAVLREYVWLDDRPLALIVGGAANYFIHTGQIGEPLMLTDASKAVAWDAAVDPWGRAMMLSTPTVDFDARLMGQWFEAASGLHQNWMRDYDPTLGRYVQADSLGLEAGQNLYAYVDGDPLNAVDPTGEFAFLAPIAVGALVGGGSDLAIQLLMNGGDFNCIDWGSVGSSALLGAVGGGIGGQALTKGLRGVSIARKGRIGENLSIMTNRLRGSRLLERNQRSIPGHSTRPDGTWRGPFGRTYYTESKFGTSRLSGPQSRALNDPDVPYNVERWSYGFFQGLGGATGGLVVGATVSPATPKCRCAK